MKGSEFVSSIIGGVAGVLLGGMVIGSKCNQITGEAMNNKRKTDSYYFLLNQWLFIRQEGKTLVEYFEKIVLRKLQYME